jgi:hypothetical protein
MKVYYRVKQSATVFVYGEDELWTANLDNGKDFSEQDALAIVKDFKNIDFRQHNEYWCR